MKIDCVGYEIRQRVYMILSFVLSVCSGILSLVFAYTVKLVVDYATSDTAVTLTETVLKIIGLLLVVLVVDLSRNAAIAKAVFYFNSITKRKLFHAFFQNHQEHQGTDFISVLNHDMMVMETDYLRAWFDLTALLTTFLVSTVTLFTYSVLHGALMLGFSAVMVLISHLLRNKTGEKRLALSTGNERYVSRVRDMFYGALVIRQFMAVGKVSSEHEEVNRELEKSRLTFSVFFAAVNTLTTIMTMSMFVVSFLLGGYFVHKGIYSLSMMMSAVQLINNIAGPLSGMIQGINKMNGAKAIAKKLRRLCAVQQTEHTVKLGRIDKIEIRDLQFGFDRSFGFQGVSVCFSRGKKYALVGESGSGKSTLLNLLVKEHAVEQGQIFFNGTDLAELSYDEIAAHIAYMNQNVYLFNDTVKNNITLYGAFSEDAYIQALKLSGVDRVLANLSGRDAYCIQQNGENISGGQKQRIALARVMLKQSDVIMLDEAFSALDPMTSEQLLHELLQLDCMMLAVFHQYNAAVLSQFDEILAMKRGNIVERGSFQELMQKGGYFYSLYHLEHTEPSEESFSS